MKQRCAHAAGAIMLLMALLAGQVAPQGVEAATGLQPLTCGDGRVDMMLEQFDTLAGLNVVRPADSIPGPTLTIVPGCNGQALAFGYDLTNTSPNGQSWIVLQKPVPQVDRSGVTHLRVALRGGNLDSHHDVDIKLFDGQLHTVQLRSMTDLPVWRTIYVDLRQFSEYATLDLASITSVEIGAVRCDRPVCDVPDRPGTTPAANSPTGTLFIDELAFVNLKPGAPHRVVQTAHETVEANRAVAASAAAAILARVTTTGAATGLVPAWFPEQSPNYNSYAQAEALLVFVHEHDRTRDPAYRDAAIVLANKLLQLQIPTGKANAGAWYTAYDATLSPPRRALPEGTQQLCDGDETMVATGGGLAANDLDACEWVGNVGWVLIALNTLERRGLLSTELERAALQRAITRGAEWLAGQIGRHPARPALIALGTEGNLSAYFGLRASDRWADAARLGEALYLATWDTIQRRMRPGVEEADAASTMDVSGSWGTSFLRAIGREQEALDQQGYTASMLLTASYDGAVIGYGDIAGPYTASVEFSAQGAVAGIKDADAVMRQLYALQRGSGAYPGAFPGATNHWYGGPLEPWNTTMEGVSPTAWMYFAASQLDPLGLERIALPLTTS